LLIVSLFLFLRQKPTKDKLKTEATPSIIIGKMKIESPAFSNQGKIPAKYTCDGENISPPLIFSEIPENTASLALIVDDPDAPAGDWVHWLLFNIDPKVEKIEEGIKPENALVGINDFNKNAYGGPCPPSGTHRYFFKVYALSKSLSLDESARKRDLEEAMEGHIIAKAELIGLYSRGK